MNKKVESLTYIAILDNNSLGVKKKINNTIIAFNKNGIKSHVSFIEDTTLKGYFKLFFSILNTDTDILILRMPTLLRMIFIFPSLIIKRLRNQKIILDIPTPLIHLKNEIWQTQSKFRAILATALLFLFYPTLLFPFNIILQYSNEHPWFLSGIKRKTKLIANGIDINTIKPRENIPAWPANKLVIIAVAHFAPWHGYERLLSGLRTYLNKRESHMPDVEIIFVGDGREKSVLEQKVSQLTLTEYVIFTGKLVDEKLMSAYECAHIAVSSLGLYKIQMELSSTLKSREYAALGLPFISADNDIDFPENTSFVFRVPNNDSEILICDIIKWLDHITDNKNLNKDIRVYAENFLDIQHKVREILNFPKKATGNL